MVYASGKKRPKYNNKKIKAEGYTFDSGQEYERYLELKLLARAGQICELEVHPEFILVPGVTTDKEKHAPIKYIGDFGYKLRRNGKYVVEDVKGYETKEFKIKKKLFRVKYGFDITIVKM